MANPDNTRLTLTPELLRRFADYHQHHLAWGSLHIVLSDGNTDRRSAEFCFEWAQEHGDFEGEHLAGLLVQMTGSQRGRLDRKVMHFMKRHKREFGYHV